MAPARLPPQLHVFARDWPSANNVLLKSREGRVLIDTGYVSHVRPTLALLVGELERSRAVPREGDWLVPA